ncbi:phage tail protein [uncultured Massilia sp.]|uniref:phage tail protein n=1 Tax=uncultured Massilia sp. TaxID=169973 RepID=UPI0025F9BCCB|nr:phage tail protein [uncultured Massilia sp.]
MNHQHNASRFAAGCALALLSALPAVAHACNDQPYVGDICTFAFDWCPRGYLPANGATVSINTYQMLYSLIGVTFGGDAKTNFVLPNLSGRSVVGTGTGANPTLVNIANAQQIGQNQVSLNANQAPLRAHTHGVGVGAVMSTQQIPIPATAGMLNVSAYLPANTNVVGSGTPPSGRAYLTNVTVKTTSNATVLGPYTATKPGSTSSLPATISVAGSGSTPAVTATVNVMTGGTVTLANTGALTMQPVSTQTPVLGMNVCIATAGVYPVQP